MTHDTATRTDAEKRLWKAIEHHNTGMLGLVGGAETSHFQPMTAFGEPQDGKLWFFTRADSDLVHEMGATAQTMFVYQQKDLQACIGGTLVVDNDRARIDKYWNPVVAAWYPQGREDPQLVLLRLDAVDAQVWITDAGPVKFAWEIAKANATKSEPDLGRQADLSFH